MEIGPAYPFDPLKRYGGERRQEEAPAARTVNSSKPEPPATAVNDVEEKTHRVAELIRERRENGYYHRTDVLREVVSRLLESKDLNIAEIRRD